MVQTVKATFKTKHGLKADIQKLEERVLALTDDTQEIFIGSSTGPIQLAKQEDLDETNNNMASLQSDINAKNDARIQDITDTNTRMNTIIGDNGNSNAEIVDARGGFPLLRNRLDDTETQLAQNTTNAYNISSGLKNFRSKVAEIKSGTNTILNVSVIADSIGEGNNAGGTPSRYFDEGYVGLIRKSMASDFGDVGRGYIPTYLTTGAPLWTFTGWTDSTGFFGTTGYSKQSAVNGEAATLVFYGSAISIHYPTRSDGGKLSVSIDGGTPTVIDTYSADQVLAKNTIISDLENGKHTMVITSVLTGSQKVWLFGAYEIKGKSGIRVNMAGRSGTTVSASSTIYAMPAELNILYPDLTIIALEANDFANQTPLSDYKSQLQSIINVAKVYGDVLLLSTGLRVFSGAIQQIEYNNILKQLSTENDCAFIDIFNRWGADANYAQNTLGFISADGVHPTSAGHQDIAKAVLDVLHDSVNPKTISTENVKMKIGNRYEGFGIEGKHEIKNKIFGITTAQTDWIDVIVFSSGAPINSSAANSILGTIKVVFSGKNSGGVVTYSGAIYDFFVDNNGGLLLQSRSTFSPTYLTASCSITLQKKTGANIIQMKVTPNLYAINGAVTVSVDYIQSMNYVADPINVDFSNLLV